MFVINLKINRMKHFLITLAVISLLISAVNCSTDKGNIVTQADLESVFQQNLKDSTLATGWYYIVDNENGFKRQLDKTEEFYVIDPEPILIKGHFDEIEIFETNFQGQYEDYLGLSLQINKKYADLWADATEKSIGKRLGLIIDNKLVNAPMVNSRIDGGMSSLNRGVYDKDELEDFIKQIED